jgi:hypothetical protein
MPILRASPGYEGQLRSKVPIRRANVKQGGGEAESIQQKKGAIHQLRE